MVGVASGVLRKGITVLTAMVCLGAAAPALAQNRMPVYVGGVIAGVQARPPAVIFGVDGSVVLGPYVRGTQRYGEPHRGHLTWTTWNRTDGRAWGGLWVDNDILA